MIPTHARGATGPARRAPRRTRGAGGWGASISAEQIDDIVRIGCAGTGGGRPQGDDPRRVPPAERRRPARLLKTLEEPPGQHHVHRAGRPGRRRSSSPSHRGACASSSGTSIDEMAIARDTLIAEGNEPDASAAAQHDRSAGRPGPGSGAGQRRRAVGTARSRFASIPRRLDGTGSMVVALADGDHPPGRPVRRRHLVPIHAAEIAHLEERVGPPRASGAVAARRWKIGTTARCADIAPTSCAAGWPSWLARIPMRWSPPRHHVPRRPHERCRAHPRHAGSTRAQPQRVAAAAVAAAGTAVARIGSSTAPR